MTDLLIQFFTSLGYVGAVIVAAFLVGQSLHKKEHFWTKILLLGMGIALFSFTFEMLVRVIPLNPYLRTTIRTSNCACVFLLTVVLMKQCCECTWWQALFCTTAGYCIEHLSQRLGALIMLLASWQMQELPMTLFTLLIRVLVYAPMYHWLFKKATLVEIKTDHRVQVLMAAIIVGFTIFVSAFSGMAVGENSRKLIQVLLYLYSIALCVIGLFVEFYQVFYHRMKTERDILQHIIAIEAEKYKKEKAAIDVINIKYHDLKHQLHRLEAEYGKEKLLDMRQAIDGYDSFFRTGNVALDTALAMKNYNCIQKKIQLTCMANGEKLRRMSEADIYTLFGNMLDNAIEAVEKLPEPKRIISLSVTSQNSFVFIHCENYCDAVPTFVDGVPKTTKQDPDYHGYGTSSLQIMAEKYGGICSFGIKDQIFNTDIVIPE